MNSPKDPLLLVEEERDLGRMCALAGCFAFTREVRGLLVVKDLLKYQINRGELSSGVAFLERNGISIKKTPGTINRLFKKNRDLANKHCTVSIGHNRYATSGSCFTYKEVIKQAHPFPIVDRRRNIIGAFCFNGNIKNFVGLSKKCRGVTRNFVSDTELLGHLISSWFSNQLFLGPSQYLSLFKHLNKEIKGAYNLLILDKFGNLVAARDPLGFRPLCYASNQKGVFIASESFALEKLGLRNVKFVGNGEIILTDVSKKIRRFQFSSRRTKKMCVFEFVYFMNNNSIFDGRKVAIARKSLGKTLAEKEELPSQETKNAVFSYIPASSKPIFEGYLKKLRERFSKIRGEEIIKKTKPLRAFIADYFKDSRIKVFKQKFKLKNRRTKIKELLLIDDSIVRGDTLKYLIPLIRETFSVKKICLRIGSPPLRFPCFYGINIASQNELIAYNRSIPEIRKELKIDSLKYTSLDEMLKAVAGKEFKRTEFCTACFNGKYPI